MGSNFLRWQHRSAIQKAIIVLPIHIIAVLPDLFSVAMYVRIKWHVQEQERLEVLLCFDFVLRNTFLNKLFALFFRPRMPSISIICPTEEFTLAEMILQSHKTVDTQIAMVWTESLNSKFRLAVEQQKESKERQCVLTALRTYCWTCFLDLAVVLQLIWTPKFPGSPMFNM